MHYGNMYTLTRKIHFIRAENSQKHFIINNIYVQHNTVDKSITYNLHKCFFYPPHIRFE